MKFRSPSRQDFNKAAEKTKAFAKKALKVGKWAGVGAFVTAALWDGGLFYNYAGPNKLTLRTSFGAVDQKHDMQPGFYFHVWPFSYTHDYSSEVQTIEFGAGGKYFVPWGENTADQNHLHAKLRLNYRVMPDKQKLGYHRWEMDNILSKSDGYWMLTRMMNASANAVMGKDNIAKIMANPDQFSKDFYEDLQFRLKQNNVPIEIESIELKKFATFFPTKSVSYQKIENPDAKGYQPLDNQDGPK